MNQKKFHLPPAFHAARRRNPLAVCKRALNQRDGIHLNRLGNVCQHRAARRVFVQPRDTPQNPRVRGLFFLRRHCAPPILDLRAQPLLERPDIYALHCSAARISPARAASVKTSTSLRPKSTATPIPRAVTKRPSTQT